MLLITGQRGQALNYFIEAQLKFANYISNEDAFYEFCMDSNNEVFLNETNKIFREIKENYSFYENVIIVSTMEDGQEILKTDGSKFIGEQNKLMVIADALVLDSSGSEHSIVGKNLSEKVFVRKVINENYSNYVSKVSLNVKNEEPVIVLSLPIKNNNEVVGALLLSIKMDYFSERYIDKFKRGETGHLFVLDNRGMVIADRIREYVLNDSVEFKEATKVISDRVIYDDERKTNETLFGIRKHYVFSKVEFSNANMESTWYVGFTQENSEIFSGITELGIKNIAILVGVGIVLFIYLYMLVKNYHEKMDKDVILHVNKMLEGRVEEKTRELRELSIRDGLTKMYNHKYIISILEDEIDKVKQSNTKNTVILMMLDIDWFKKVNDNYGHQIGDEVLIKVSKIMSDKAGENGVVGRYGGEEFLLVLKAANLNLGIAIAEDIRESISNLTIENTDLHITISIGLAKLEGHTASELIKESDTLLYDAKNSGRNCVKH